jgi:hypothetical protein
MSVRRAIIGLGLAAAALACWLVLAWFISDTRAHPQPVMLEETAVLDGQLVRVTVNIDHTRTLFRHDCQTLSWTVTGARVVMLDGSPADASGSRTMCEAGRITLGALAEGGGVWQRPFHHWALFDFAEAHALLFGGAGMGLAGLVLLRPRTGLLAAVGRARLVQYGAALAVAVAFTLALDAFTNTLDTARYTWDWVHYLDMAQNGIAGNPNLVAPYAYRPMPPALAGLFAELTGRSVLTGFRLIAYAGIVGQMVMAFALARLFLTGPRRFWGAFVVMLAAGLATPAAKFYLFDVLRTDPLAFPLVLLGAYALVRRERAANTGHVPLGWDTLLTASALLGMSAREFSVLPLGMLGVCALRGQFRRRLRGYEAAVGLLAGGAALAGYVLPRLLIPVGRSDQLFDVISPADLAMLWPRNLNLLIGFLLALLPVWLLLSPGRARRLWGRLGGLRLPLGVYMLGVVGLSWAGGTDISRFMAFLLVPLVVLLACLIEDGVPAWQVLLALGAWGLFHRTFALVPQATLDDYLDFYIVYWDRQSAVTWARVGEAAAWVAVVWAVRMAAWVLGRVRGKS